MNTPVIFSLFGYDDLAHAIQESLGYEMGEMDIHEFPDQEISIRIHSSIKDSPVIFVGSLDHPNGKIATLLFAAETARALGATQIGLITPYLPYMRQDKAFHPGEGITSKFFAKLISDYFDWMITLAPHLHRWHSLDQIFNIRTYVLHATRCISEWINQNISDPLLIGPDSESKQWVSELAKEISAPCVILEKKRISDTVVEVEAPEIDSYRDRTPILVDDIISTGTTMIHTLAHLKSMGTKAPVCIGVHAIFSGHAYEKLLKAGTARVVTCNAVQHPSNAIDISELIIAQLRALYPD